MTVRQYIKSHKVELTVGFLLLVALSVSVRQNFIEPEPAPVAQAVDCPRVQVEMPPEPQVEKPRKVAKAKLNRSPISQERSEDVVLAEPIQVVQITRESIDQYRASLRKE